MVKRKKISAITALLSAVCLLLSACGSGTVFDDITGASIDFPLQDDGYPDPGAAIINGETFALYDDASPVEIVEKQLSVKATDDGRLEVIVAKGGAITEWRASDNVRLINYAEFEPKISAEDIKDGASGTVQRFVLGVPAEKATVVFKLINVLEASDKSFDELDCIYRLTLTVEMPRA